MTDIYETFDYGYDPSVPEDIALGAPPQPATAPPPKAHVNPIWLPPVGKQTTPSCFVWSSTYGCATFAAAKANNLDPSSPANQASPLYTYIKVEEQQGVAANNCSGGKILWPLAFLKSNGGTPSMATAPNEVGCAAAWTNYGSATLPADWRFQVMAWSGTPLNNGAEGLANMRNLIWTGTPIVYGTHLYTDFPPYDGTPSPYVGNGTWLYNENTGKLAGHCMMIIGYDDTKGAEGAVLIQNSFGSTWGCQWNGNGGYIWMAYSTFQTMAEGGGSYITLMQTQGPR